MSYRDTDTPSWTALADVLDEVGMPLAELIRQCPGLDIDHVGLDGETILDRQQIDDVGVSPAGLTVDGICDRLPGAVAVRCDTAPWRRKGDS